MKVSSYFKVAFAALTLAHASHFLTPEKAQAHHNSVHSTEQAATKAAVDTAAMGEKVAVKAASETSTTLPLATGGAVLLSLAGIGLYTVRKKQSV